MTRRMLVVSHRGRPQALAAAAETVRALHDQGIEAVEVGADDTGPVDGIEAAIVLGGDGTILRAAELTRGTGAPLLGVNLGHVGFLAESEREDIADAVHRMATGAFEVEERSTIEVTALPADGGPAWSSWALNEVAIEKAAVERMVEVVIEVDGRPLSSFGCDGIIVATATGSTAHAFSAGGPVVWPDVVGMIVVPIAAHALFARPLVVGPSSVVALEVVARGWGDGELVCDSRRRVTLAPGARVEVRTSDTPVRLARLTRAPFTDRLVSKFALPVSGWRGREG